MVNVVTMGVVILCFALFIYIYSMSIKWFFKSKTEENKLLFQSLPFFSFITIMNGMFWLVSEIGRIMKASASDIVGWSVIGSTALEGVATVLFVVAIGVAGLVQANMNRQELLKITSYAWLIGLVFWLLLEAMFFLPIVIVLWKLIRMIVKKVKPKNDTDIDNDNKIEW